MKPSALRTLLAACIAAKRTVLVTGQPGIGKSDVIDCARRDAQADLILSHPVVEDATESKGLPWFLDGKATFLPFGQLARALAATRLTVWFLDDLGQAAPAVQAAYMQLLLAREVNGHKLPDCVTFVAATNRRTDRAGVSGILEPVKSRFATIVELTPDLPEWCEWAVAHDLPAEIIAFLRFQPDAFNAFKPSADLVNCPSPRTWNHVGQLLALGLPPAVQAEAICGAVGEGAGTGFNAFLRLFAELPSVDGILLDPAGAPIPDSPASLYALSGALAMRATPATFTAIGKYAQRLLQAGKGEFAVLILRDAVRRCPAVQSTPAFVRLTVGDLGKLYTGQAA